MLHLVQLCSSPVVSLQNSCDQPSGYCAAAFADVKSLALFQGNGTMNIANHFDIVARHDHLRVSVLSAIGPVESSSLIYKNTIRVV